jgi:hypothetical protein
VEILFSRGRSGQKYTPVPCDTPTATATLTEVQGFISFNVQRRSSESAVIVVQVAPQPDLSGER